jgi:hypothetical protein
VIDDLKQCVVETRDESGLFDWIAGGFLNLFSGDGLMVLENLRDAGRVDDDISEFGPRAPRRLMKRRSEAITCSVLKQRCSF